MIQYHEHYIAVHYPNNNDVKVGHRMIHPVKANSGAEAIEICKTKRPGSFGHWVNTRDPADVGVPYGAI